MDTTTRGNWRATHGNAGYDIAQDSSGTNPNLPSYAEVSITGASNLIWGTNTGNPYALQNAAAYGDIAATWYSSTSFNINIDLTDGQTHRVALYTTDWDNVVSAYASGQSPRSERFDVINTNTGTLLDSRTLSSFLGSYLVWNLQGNVTIRVINLGSSYNGVVSGIFFDTTPPAASASFVGTDVATQGNWKGIYGGTGFDLSQDPGANNPTLPPYATLVSMNGAQDYAWTAPSSDIRALQEAAPGSTNRIAGVWYSYTSFSINLVLTDSKPNLLALYALDWDNLGGGRSERIDLIDSVTGTLLNSQALSSFQNGKYLVWNVTGSITIRVTNLNPPSNAVLNGLFLGSPQHSQTTPTITVSAAGGVYDGSPSAATASVMGVDGTSGASLEGVNPVLTYYRGSTAAGTPLAGPPTAVGTYTVVAAFPGSVDYTPATAQTTFTVTPAKRPRRRPAAR
jgi:hypothetical protein